MMKLIISTILLLISLNASFGQSKADYYFRVLSDFEKGHTSAALALSDSLVGIFPEDAVFIRLNAGLYFKTGNYLKSQRMYALLIPYDQATARLNMARCLALVNDVEAAINELKEFLTLPEVFNIADVKADTCFRYIFASKEWSEFWRGFEPDSEKLVLAELEYLLKQKEFTEVLHDNNSFSNSRYTYMAELMKTDALIELKQYKEALKKVNGILKDTLSYELLLRRAEVFSAMNEYIKAVIDISDVIELNPYEIDYYLQRAVASNNAQIYEQAISDLRYYLRFFEDHEEVWYKLSVVLLNAGINSEAVDVLSKLIAMNSGNELYFLLRAETYSNLTNYTGAVSDYLMALDLNPRNADTYISLGWCKHRLDDNAKACYYWHKAAHLGHPEAEFLLQQYCK